MQRRSTDDCVDVAVRSSYERTVYPARPYVFEMDVVEVAGWHRSNRVRTDRVVVVFLDGDGSVGVHGRNPGDVAEAPAVGLGDCSHSRSVVEDARGDSCVIPVVRVPPLYATVVVVEVDTVHGPKAPRHPIGAVPVRQTLRRELLLVGKTAVAVLIEAPGVDPELA